MKQPQPRAQPLIAVRWQFAADAVQRSV